MSKTIRKTGKYKSLKRLDDDKSKAIPLQDWIVIVLVLSFIFGLLYFFGLRNIFQPEHIEFFTAEVSDLWIKHVDDDFGGFQQYNARVKINDNEITCEIPSHNMDLWLQLEEGASFKFEVKRVGGICIVLNVEELTEENGD